MSTNTNYWVIDDGTNTIQLATSRANAIAGTQVDITAAAGGGTHTVDQEAYIVVTAGVARMAAEAQLDWEAAGSGQRAVEITLVDASLNNVGPTKFLGDLRDHSGSSFQRAGIDDFPVSEGWRWFPKAFNGDSVVRNLEDTNATWFRAKVTGTDVGPPEPISHWQNGTPATNSVIFRKIFARKSRVGDALKGWKAYFETAPSGGSVDITVKKNGTTIGTIAFADGSNTPTLSTAASQNYDFDPASDDRMTFETPGDLQGAADLMIEGFAWRIV